MFNFTNTLRQALLALSLAVTAFAAHADVIPTYKVTINTSGASGTGYLDFSFARLDGAPAATATISNLIGAAYSVDPGLEANTVTDIGPDAFSMLNDFSYRSLVTEFGGVFSFDLAFTGDFLTTDFADVSTFAVFAFNSDNVMLGNGEAVTFSLYSPNGGAAPMVEVANVQGLADVAAIPEPSELLLMLTGLALIGAVARRRQR